MINLGTRIRLSREARMEVFMLRVWQSESIY